MNLGLEEKYSNILTLFKADENENVDGQLTPIVDRATNLIVGQDDSLQATPSNKPLNPFMKSLRQQSSFSNQLRLKAALVPAVQFVDLNLNDYDFKKSPTDRMRYMDTLRLYSPTSDERHRSAIPSSMERINIRSRYDILVLCGGLAGMRFSSEDLLAVDELVQQLNDDFCALDIYFNSLSTAAKRFILNDMQYDRLRNGFLINECPATAPLLCLTAVDRADDTTVTEIQVYRFHHMGANYLRVIQQLQLLVKRKLANLPADSGGFERILETTSGTSEVASKTITSADPELAKALPMPIWLSILTQKFIKEYPTGKSTSKIDQINSVGKFACFLSFCILGLITCRSLEEEALRELTQASSDGTDFPTTSSSLSPQTVPKTQRYWAGRFFQFLKHLSELKSVPKDEKSLFLFKEFVNVNAII